MIVCYRKTHLFFEETLFFTPVTAGSSVGHWSAKVGVMICLSWYYPESARTLALQGAEIIAPVRTWCCRIARIPW